MKKRMSIIALLLLSIALAGCVQIGTENAGNRIETHEAQEYEELDRLDVNIKMGVGELNVKDGSDQIFEGDFIYTDNRWAPIIDYRSGGRRGELSIKNPPMRKANLGHNNRNQWNIILNNEPDIDLELELGVGKSKLALQNLNISKIDIEMGVGEAEVDLNGHWEKDIEVNIQGGVGSAVVILPKDMGVYAEIQGGIGSINGGGLNQEGEAFTNDLYQKTSHTMKLNIEAGIGEIVLK